MGAEFQKAQDEIMVNNDGRAMDILINVWAVSHALLDAKPVFTGKPVMLHSCVV